MTPDCDLIQLELSVAHDEHGSLDSSVRAHLSECDDCAGFARLIGDLDEVLARDRFHLTPDIVTPVMERVGPQRQWWFAAAVAIIGLTVGAVIGGLGARLDTVQARDLAGLFHEASPALEGFEADVIVVERGVHPEVPERIYSGRLAYSAPESLELRLLDTTRYPTPEWVPNDVSITIEDDALVTSAPNSCPVAALPNCLRPAVSVALEGRIPFGDGPTTAHGLIGTNSGTPAWAGVEIVGAPTLADRPTIQVRTTVAAVDMIESLTALGAWRELHPTDAALVWLDEETLVPLRIEVSPAGSPERELWELRRDYRDTTDSEPILIVELSNFSTEPRAISIELPEDVRSAGFVEASVPEVTPVLPEGFTAHRSGRWTLPDGGDVLVSTWSDGRSWLMVQTTSDWTDPRLFGISTAFARRIDLGGGVGYLDPLGRSIALHTGEIDVLISGSVSQQALIEAAGSLGIEGEPLPPDWEQASTIQAGELPSRALVPTAEGWLTLSRVGVDRVTTLMVGSGASTVMIRQVTGERLEPPEGPDSIVVDVRATSARFDPGSSVLEWVENSMIVSLQGNGVGLEDLVDIAEKMETG